MKKILITLVVLLLGVSVFASWSKNYYVDDFGDKTDIPYLTSEFINIKYGEYSWENESCRILIDEDNVSFSIGKTYYDEWTLKTKNASGEIHNFRCKLSSSTGRLFINDYSSSGYKNTKVFLSDLLVGCRIVLTPNNQFADDKFDFGTMSITLEELRQVRPNWGK